MLSSTSMGALFCLFQLGGIGFFQVERHGPTPALLDSRCHQLGFGPCVATSCFFCLGKCHPSRGLGCGWWEALTCTRLLNKGTVKQQRDHTRSLWMHSFNKYRSCWALGWALGKQPYTTESESLPSGGSEAPRMLGGKPQVLNLSCTQESWGELKK